MRRNKGKLDKIVENAQKVENLKETLKEHKPQRRCQNYGC
jgi:3-methyladenine DNA glycosylase Tag